MGRELRLRSENNPGPRADEKVRVYYPRVPTTPAETAGAADGLVIGGPIDVTAQVIGDLKPEMRFDALLMDVSAV